jgi:hypothetical protein
MKRAYPITVYVEARRQRCASAHLYGANEKQPFDLKGLQVLGTFAGPAELGQALIEWAMSHPLVVKTESRYQGAVRFWGGAR